MFVLVRFVLVRVCFGAWLFWCVVVSVRVCFGTWLFWCFYMLEVYILLCRWLSFIGCIFNYGGLYMFKWTLKHQRVHMLGVSPVSNQQRYLHPALTLIRVCYCNVIMSYNTRVLRLRN